MTENSSPQRKDQIHIPPPGDAKNQHVTKDIAEEMTTPRCYSNKDIKDDLPKGITIPYCYSDCRKKRGRRKLQMRVWDIQRLLLGNLLSWL